MNFKFRIPHKCQNGHFRYMYWEPMFDGITNNISWGEKRPECDCPTGNMGEGFAEFGPHEMWSGWHDKDERKIYHNDIVELIDQEGHTIHALCELGVAQRVFDSGYKCDIAGFYFKKGTFKSFPIIKNYAGKHDTKMMTVVGNIHQNKELLK